MSLTPYKQPSLKDKIEKVEAERIRKATEETLEKEEEVKKVEKKKKLGKRK